MAKCSVGDCARDAVKCFTGTGVRGRPREGVIGVPYCKAHHARMQRGADMSKPIRERLRPGQRRDPYAEAVEDCAVICMYHGHEDLAALLRGLNR